MSLEAFKVQTHFYFVLFFKIIDYSCVWLNNFLESLCKDKLRIQIQFTLIE